MSARQLFSTMAASSTITRSTARRCTMRSLGLLASLTLLASTALFAQHATTMPPPSAVNTTVTAPHITATTPAIHTSVSAPHGIASTPHTVAQTPHIATVKTNETRISGAKPNPERHGLFSWFRKREPVGSDSQDRRKERRNSSPNYLALQIPPSTAHAHHGCTIVPVSNPGIPCNPLAPCCP